MLPLLVLLISLLAAHSQAERVFYAPEEAEHHFEKFITTFNRQYANEGEKQYRFYIFKKNLAQINELNARNQAIYGITQFTDLTISEVFRNYTGFSGDSVSLPNMCQDGVFEANLPAPESLDWRSKGKVTRVKNQERCGSCWAFSTIGNLEGQYAIKHNKLVEFSEQQLVDCDRYDYGCNGGLMSAAMTWLNRSGGVELEKDYPYKGNADSCKFDEKKAKVQVTDCYIYEKKTEDELKQILAEVGPLAIALSFSELMFYKEGVAECDKCRHDINHALLLVGYGKDGDKPYWLIKNSWGENWGEMGYIRLAMYKNSCQILTYIVSAVIA